MCKILLCVSSRYSNFVCVFVAKFEDWQNCQHSSPLWMKALHSSSAWCGLGSGSPLVSALITGDNFESFPCASCSESMLPVHSWMIATAGTVEGIPDRISGLLWVLPVLYSNWKLNCYKNNIHLVRCPAISWHLSVMSKGCDSY